MQTCLKCDSSGLVIAVKLSNKAIHAFRCDGCDIARIRGLSQIVPLWQSTNLNEFRPDYEEFKEFKKEPEKPRVAVATKPIVPMKQDFAARAANDYDEEDSPF